MTRKKNDVCCDLENVARELMIASSQDEFASVNDDNFAETRETVAAMRYRVRCWDELDSKYLLLQEKFRQIDWMMHKGKICFPVIPIGRLLGICPQNTHDVDGWIVDFVFSELRVEFSIGGKLWIDENGVFVLIDNDSSFPKWLRGWLGRWFRSYCEEIRAKNTFA